MRLAKDERGTWRSAVGRQTLTACRETGLARTTRGLWMRRHLVVEKLAMLSAGVDSRMVGETSAGTHGGQ